MTITIDWEAEGAPKKDGRQTWRAEHDDPHYVAELRPENGAFGPYYNLHLQLGTVDIQQHCHCVEMGRLYAQAWLEQMPVWNERVHALVAAGTAQVNPAPMIHGRAYPHVAPPPCDVHGVAALYVEDGRWNCRACKPDNPALRALKRAWAADE
jgi:hypothetical protein